MQTCCPGGPGWLFLADDSCITGDDDLLAVQTQPGAAQPVGAAPQTIAHLQDVKTMRPDVPQVPAQLGLDLKAAWLVASWLAWVCQVVWVCTHSCTYLYGLPFQHAMLVGPHMAAAAISRFQPYDMPAAFPLVFLASCVPGCVVPQTATPVWRWSAQWGSSASLTCMSSTHVYGRIGMSIGIVVAVLIERSHQSRCVQALQRAVMLPTSGVVSCTLHGPGRARSSGLAEVALARQDCLKTWAAAHAPLVEALSQRVQRLLGS